MSEVEVPASLPEAMREVSKSNSREWDGNEAIDAIPGARLEAEKSLAKEYIQQEAQEPEEVEAQAEENAVEDDAAEEVENDSQEAEPEPVQAAEEEVTPRADKRIQKLVAEKKAAESKMEALLERLANAELARQQAEEQRQQEVAYERHMRQLELQKQQRMRMLEEAGFDPTDPRNQYMLTVGDENTELKNKLLHIEQQLQARQEQERQAEGWRVYNSNLDKALKSTLAGRQLDPEVEADIRKAVTAMATINNSADPIEEVRTVLRPYMKVMKTTSAPQKAANPAVNNIEAHRAVSTKGSAGNKQAGQKAGSAKPGRLTLDQAREALFGSAKTEWDR